MPAQLVTLDDALARIRDGDTLLCGGFGLVGAALTLLDGLATLSTARDLTVVSNNIGEAGRGLGVFAAPGPHQARHLVRTSRRTPRPSPP